MIRNLKIRNFKSLRDVELRLSKMNVLVGPNMAGKSNILEALHFLFQAFTGTEGLANALALRGGMNEVHWKGSDDNLIAFELDWVGAETGRSFFYVLEFITGAGGYVYVQKETLRLRDNGVDHELIVPDRTERWLCNVSGDRVVMSRGSNRSAIENAPPNWDGAPFAEAVASWRFYKLLPSKMKVRNPVGVGTVLQPDGSNLSAWLMNLQTKHDEEFKRIMQAVRDVLPNIKSLLTWPTEEGMVHLASNEIGLKRPINVWQMSDGELAFIALVSLLYSPPDFGGDLFCIEEPENYLHPNLLNTLLQLTRQVRENIIQSGAPAAQLLITTQSAQLVDSLSLDEVIWLERRGGETRVLRPSDREHLREIVQSKELGLGDIVYSGLLSDQ